MVKTFNIKSGSIEYADTNPWWFLKSLWSFVSRGNYKREFRYRITVQVDSFKGINVSDVFITGLAKPHIPFLITSKRGTNQILALSLRNGFSKTPPILGICAIVATNAKEV